MLRLSRKCDGGRLQERKRRNKKKNKPVVPEFNVKVPKKKYKLIRLVWFCSVLKQLNVVYQIHKQQQRHQKQQHGFKIH